MLVKEIMVLAAELCGRRDLADFLAGRTGADAGAMQREEETLLAEYALDFALLAADALSRAAAQEVSVNRQQWLPKLEIGYRRNTSLDEASHGFLAGVSLPLFANRREVKIARAQSAAASLSLEDARLRAEADLQALYNEARQLREALQAYDPALMRRTLQLLLQAVQGGQMPSTDYYVEADAVYRSMQALAALECQYHQTLARLYRNEL